MKRIFSRQALQIAATYIGTVVGAGFGSGQEVLQFFGFYGAKGLLGVVVATLMFAFFGIQIMHLGHRLHARSHREVLIYLCGPSLGKLMDWVITLFLLGATSVMLAGSGAIFAEHLHLPYWVGVISTIVLVILTALFGLRGILAVNSLIVPLLIIFVTGICGYNLLGHTHLVESISIYRPDLGVAPHWLLAAILYVAYNLILTTAVFAPLGAKIHDPNLLTAGGLLGGGILGLLAFMLTLTLLVHYPTVTRYQVPILYVISPYGLGIKILFTLVLWGEIFSTIIGDVYGLTARLQQATSLPGLLLTGTCLGLATLITQFGFAKLVSIIYPLLGYISLIFIGALILAPFKERNK